MTTKNTNNDDLLTNAGFIECQAALSKAFDIFVEATKKAVSPTTFDSKAQWAVQHDDNMNYDGSVLNIDKKTELDHTLDDYTGVNSYAQQQLHLLENSTLTDPDELEIKNSEIEYITTWLELMHTLYDNFLDTVTLDEETLSEKYDLIRENLVDYYYSDMQSDYVADMEMFAGWTRDDVEEWREDGSVVPEDFVDEFLENV